MTEGSRGHRALAETLMGYALVTHDSDRAREAVSEGDAGGRSRGNAVVDLDSLGIDVEFSGGDAPAIVDARRLVTRVADDPDSFLRSPPAGSPRPHRPR